MTAGTNSTVLHFDNDLAQRQVLLDAAVGFCRRAGGDDRSVGRIRLVLDELFTNIVSYAYDDDEAHRITVELTDPEAGIVAITLIDDGRAFNPLDRPPPDLDAAIEERRVGGFGIHLVKTFMDTCEYRRDGDTNRLTITKEFRRPARVEEKDPPGSRKRRSSRMKVSVSQDGPVTIVEIEGKIDTATCDDVETALLAAIDKGANRMVIDLAEVDYISSAGLRSVLIASKKIKALKGRVAFCNLRPMIFDVFDASGFTTILTVCATRGEAVAVCRS